MVGYVMDYHLQQLLTRALDLFERYIIVQEAKHNPEYLKNLRGEMNQK